MDEDNSKLIDLEYIATLVTQGLAPIHIPGHTPFILKPINVGVYTPLREDEIPLPDHIRQQVNITTMSSFISYVTKFKTHTAQIFATVGSGGAIFTAVLDYHESGIENVPGRSVHRATYTPAFSPEFKAWQAIHGKALTQDQFLDHLRTWGDTITSHTDADLIELASSLEFTINGGLSSKVERVRGGRQLHIDEAVEGTGTIKGRNVTVPEQLSIKVPVFDRGELFDINADILYRPQGGLLKIIIELRRAHVVLRNAIDSMINDVAEGTSLEVFHGTL